MRKCIIKGCREDVYKDKFLCEKHWKGRRKNKNYKEVK